jgi:hypothetical protein
MWAFGSATCVVGLARGGYLRSRSVFALLQLALLDIQHTHTHNEQKRAAACPPLFITPPMPEARG